MSTPTRSSTCADRVSCGPSWTGAWSSSTPRRRSIRGGGTRSMRSSTACASAPTPASGSRSPSKRLSRSRRASPGSRSRTSRTGSRSSSRTATRARPAATASPSSSHACSPSTTRAAPAAPAAASGVQEFFDPARVVVNPALSLAGGAVRGWDRRNAYYFQLIQSLARHYRFDIEAPWNDLSEAVRHVLLWGSGEERVEFRYFDARGGSARRSHAWEGILPNLERRYRETESATVREELAKYRGTRACVDCGGSRLMPRRAQRLRRGPHAARARGAADRGFAPVLRGAQARGLARRGREPAGARGVRPAHVPQPTSGSTTCRSTAAPRRSRAARRSASAWRARSVPGWSASCTSSTSPRSGCTSATTSGCSTRSRDSATSATPSWSSSTTRTRSARPITSWTSARAPASTAATSSRRARRPRSRPRPNRSPAST